MWNPSTWPGKRKNERGEAHVCFRVVHSKALGYERQEARRRAVNPRRRGAEGQHPLWS